MHARRAGPPVSMDDDLPFLGATPYFRSLSPEELAGLCRRCHLRELEAGELILLEGAPAEALYVVRGGSVRVFKTAKTGAREQVLIVLGPGETFNDVPVFDGGPNPASAQATVPGTRVYAVPRTLVAHLIATNPRFAGDVIRVLAGRLRHLTGLVGDLSLRDALQRLAKLLLEESAPTGEVGLTQQEMATRVGVVREVVSRALRELETRGIIARRHNRIVRVDTALLRLFLEHGV